MSRRRLTQGAIDALLRAAEEVLAGHDAEMAEAAGYVAKSKGNKNGDRFLDALGQGVAALKDRRKPAGEGEAR